MNNVKVLQGINVVIRKHRYYAPNFLQFTLNIVLLDLYSRYTFEVRYDPTVSINIRPFQDLISSYSKSIFVKQNTLIERSHIEYYQKWIGALSS